MSDVDATRPAIRVLLLEDEPDDAEVILIELRRAGFRPVWVRAATEQEYLERLAPDLDVILADFTLPQFNALGALRHLRERQLDVPLIVVTGTIGEDLAVECMRQGAADYLLKDRLSRLGQAVRQAIEARAHRRGREEAEAALRASEDRYRDLVEHCNDLICTHALDGRILSVNQVAVGLTGYAESVLLTKNLRDLLMPEFRDDFERYLAVIARDSFASGVLSVVTATGERRVLEYYNSLRTDGVDVPVVRAVARDITERHQTQKERDALLARERQARAAAERARRHADALSEAARRVGESLELEPVLAAVLDAARSLFSADRAAIFHGDEAGALSPLASFGLSPRYLDAVCREFSRLKAGPQSYATGQPAFVSNLAALTFGGSLDAIVAAEGVHGLMAVPLVRRGKSIGNLAIYHDEPHEFTDDEVQLAQGLASQVAIAIDNARLYGRLRERAGQIEALLEGTRQISASLDLQPVLATVIEAARRLFGADRVAIYQREESERWSCAASFGLSGPYLDTICRLFPETPAGGRAAATRSPVAIADLADRDSAGPTGIFQSASSDGVRAVLALPLLRGGEVLGVLALYHDRPHHYPNEELELVGALANQAAIAIDHARLYEAAESRAREVEALLDATKQIVGSLDLTTTLDSILDTAVRLCEADIATVALLNPDGMSLSHLSARGPQAHQVQPASFRLGEGLTGQVAQTRQVLNISAVESHPLRLYRVVPKSAGMRSLILIPLLQREAVIGVLCVWSRQPGHFVAARERLLRGLADQAALAIDHARQAVDRERAEQALRETNETLRALIEASPLAIMALDRDGKVTLWNTTAERMFGWQQEEMLGRPIPIVPPDELGSFRTLGGGALAGQARTGVEVRPMRKDGSRVDVSLSVAPLRAADGTVVGSVGLLADITGRKQLEVQLRQAQKMEAVGRLAGGVAHDFNNLLTIVTGFCELLLNDLGSTDPKRGFVEEIQKAGGSAVALTRQLLAFSRQQVLQPQDLDLNAVVTGFEKMLGRLIGEDLELVAELEPALGAVRADPGQVEQVIMNLAVNARDAMPRGGRLLIETANVELDEEYAHLHHGVRPGAYVMLSITDTGVGMDAATQARIFEPFFTTKGQGKGTGLGLSTVYGIVQQSGGHIGVYSEVGRGTTFKVYLPRLEKPRATPGPGARPGRAVTGSETILLVEDESTVRLLVCKLLRASGYTVIEAEHGEAALAIAGSHPGPIDLLITDLVMPGLGGREVAERLAKLHPATRVLYMSGYTDDAVIRHGALAPGMAFLQKPFTMTALTQKVRQVLDAPPT